MDVTDTVSWLELLWTVAAVPGAFYWFRNLNTARRSLSAVRLMNLGNGRRLWAEFSVALTSAFLAIEVVFVLIGVVAMARVSAPGAALPGTIAIAGGLIASSVGITYLAYRWRGVDRQLLAAARVEHRDRSGNGERTPPEGVPRTCR